MRTEVGIDRNYNAVGNRCIHSNANMKIYISCVCPIFSSYNLHFNIPTALDVKTTASSQFHKENSRRQDCRTEIGEALYSHFQFDKVENT